MPRELLDEIFSLDKGIRYISILNFRGAHLEGGMRPGTISLNPENEENKLFLQATVSRGMSESWSRHFGAFKFSIISHSKLNIFQFPYGENVLLVTTEPNIRLSITEDIHRIVESYKRKSPRESLR